MARREKTGVRFASARPFTAAEQAQLRAQPQARGDVIPLVRRLACPGFRNYQRRATPATREIDRRMVGEPAEE